MRKLTLIALLAVALAACGGREDEEMTQAEAREKAKDGAFGAQIEALDKAAAAKDALEQDIAEREAAADAAFEDEAAPDENDDQDDGG